MARQELQNEFSWSKSRHGKFSECRRLYWFHYYGAWGGWESTARPEVREAYILKNLSSRWQWAGKVVHSAVAFALSMARAGTPPPPERVIDGARNQMREDFRKSRRGEYRAYPKRVVGLLEHELNEPITDEQWKATWDLAELSLKNFYSSAWMQKARTLTPEQWLPIDEIDSFPLEGIKVFAGPDFAFRENGSVVLVDWKTGKPRPEDQEQVKGYALFAQAKWGAHPDKVVARLVYLGQGEELDVRCDPASLDGFKEEFRASVAAMKRLLRDPVKNVAHADDFPMTEALERCRGCAFRKLCGREPVAAGGETQAA